MKKKNILLATSEGFTLVQQFYVIHIQVSRCYWITNQSVPFLFCKHYWIKARVILIFKKFLFCRKMNAFVKRKIFWKGFSSNTWLLPHCARFPLITVCFIYFLMANHFLNPLMQKSTLPSLSQIYPNTMCQARCLPKC